MNALFYLEEKMKRLTKIISVAFCAIVLVACGGASEQQSSESVEARSQQTYQWKLVTTWPKNFPGIGIVSENFADLVDELSEGRMKIRVYGAGEIVPAFEVFDAVRAGTAEMGHGASYFWKGKAPEAQFFSALPFGLNGKEMDSWIQFGGGIELWEELYEPFNLIPVPGGNTGVQMGGWFNKEINSLEDFQGLKMRIPGLGGEVIQKIGGVPVNLAAGELYTSLQTGVIDATEFVGPLQDLSLGFYDVADYYYYPGWHEPGTALEFMFNKELFEALPEDLQLIIRTAAYVASASLTLETVKQNSDAVKTLVEEHGVELRQFPRDLNAELYRVSQEVINELGQGSEIGQRILDSYRTFEADVRGYHDISIEAYNRLRAEERD